MYLKNCTGNEMEVSGQDGRVMIYPGYYAKFRPNNKANYGAIYWKKTTGNIKK